MGQGESSEPARDANKAPDSGYHIVQDVDDKWFEGQLAQSVGKDVALIVYSSQDESFRSVTLVPSNSWGGTGVVGVSIRFCSIEKAAEHVWHVLEVHPNSPASVAGLRAHEDYIVGTPEYIFNDAEDFYSLVKQRIGQPLPLYVYSVKDEDVRIVSIIPRTDWGGAGALGCDIGFGLLHKIPRSSTAPPLSQQHAPTSAVHAHLPLRPKPVDVPPPTGGSGVPSVAASTPSKLSPPPVQRSLPDTSQISSTTAPAPSFLPSQTVSSPAPASRPPSVASFTQQTTPSPSAPPSTSSSAVPPFQYSFKPSVTPASPSPLSRPAAPPRSSSSQRTYPPTPVGTAVLPPTQQSPPSTLPPSTPPTTVQLRATPPPITPPTTASTQPLQPSLPPQQSAPATVSPTSSPALAQKTPATSPMSNVQRSLPSKFSNAPFTPIDLSKFVPPSYPSKTSPLSSPAPNQPPLQSSGNASAAPTKAPHQHQSVGEVPNELFGEPQQNSSTWPFT